jgi:hypothetical protein
MKLRTKHTHSECVRRNFNPLTFQTSYSTCTLGIRSTKFGIPIILPDPCVGRNLEYVGFVFFIDKIQSRLADNEVDAAHTNSHNSQEHVSLLNCSCAKQSFKPFVERKPFHLKFGI